MPDAVVSVIPAFRPESETRTLADTLASVAPVLVSDDASPCTYDAILSRIAGVHGVQLIQHARNEGIGRGLNEGLTFAQDSGATWLLTADQDSTITAKYFEMIIEWATQLIQHGVPVGAVGAGLVRDASGPMTYPTRTECVGKIRYLVTEEIIQSGTLWHVPSLARHGGFNQNLGMDAVDAEACLGLRELGRVIIVAEGLEFDHRIGRARQMRVLGRPIMATLHAPHRRFFMIRNRLILFPREFCQSPRHAVRTVRRAMVNAALSSLPFDRPKSPLSRH